MIQLLSMSIDPVLTFWYTLSSSCQLCYSPEILLAFKRKHCPGKFWCVVMWVHTSVWYCNSRMLYIVSHSHSIGNWNVTAWWCCLCTCAQAVIWAVRYNTCLFIKLTPKGVVFSLLFLFFSFHVHSEPVQMVWLAEFQGQAKQHRPGTFWLALVQAQP